MTATAQIAPLTGTSVELRVFEAEPLLRWLSRHRIPHRTLLLAPFVVAATLVITCALTGNLSQPDLGSALCHDATVFTFSPHRHACFAQSASTTMSLSRDVFSLMLAAILAASPALVYRQWLGMSEVFSDMASNKILNFKDAEARAAFYNEVESANRHFARVGRVGALPAAFAMLVMLLASVAEHSGIYGVFAPQGVDRSTWARQTYGTWWASLTHNPVGWVLYFLIGMVGVYFILIMNLVGGRVVILLSRTRKLIRLGASPDNLDGYFGWARAREILLPTYEATALHGFALTLMVLTVRPNTLWLLAPVLLQWLFVCAPYVALPLTVCHRSISRYKRDEERHVQQLLLDLHGDGSPAADERREILARRLERVRSIRSFPFRRVRDVVGAALSMIGALASIYAVIAVWYHFG